MLKNMFLVGFGGMVGSLSRYGMGLLAQSMIPSAFPFATFAVNILGSFLIGAIFALSSGNLIPAEGRLLLATGFCGGFTTFSSFMLDIHGLVREGAYLHAAGYFSLSVALGFAALWAGIVCTKIVFRV